MCGIAGIVGRVNDKNRDVLSRMGLAMHHRGPDGAGIWQSRPDDQGNGCMLLHTRLAILDLTNHAHQPMVDPVTGHAIAFNGEIYNFQLLRERMKQAGQTFLSTGDTAVLLRQMSLHGWRTVDQLRGMFAFGLWDPQACQLVLARDPHGIKPLYFCFSRDVGGSDEWSLIFASEIRALLAANLIPSPRIDPDAVASIVWNGFVTGPNTIIKNVRSMWPGEAMVVGQDGRIEDRARFWKIPTRQAQTASSEAFAGALGESVHLHLRSDVPMGVFLSSGVDSSSVANHAMRARETAINTFTLAFEEQEYNEGVWSKKIAGALGTKHHEIVLTESVFTSALEQACDCLDQPSFDGINSYYMSKAVRESGMIVALVGTGGDELFGGYRSFTEVPKLMRLARKTRFVPGALKQLGARAVAKLKSGRAGAVAPQTRWAKLPAMLAARDDTLALYQLAYALFLPAFQRELLIDGINPLPNGLPGELESRLRDEYAGASTLEAISVLEQRLFLGERLLRDTDAASMSVSIETRLPLVDSVLTQNASRLPVEQRYHPPGRKQMLRDAGLTGLDPGLFSRPKSGFVIPFDRWIRAGLGRAMDDLMRDRKVAADVGLNGEVVARLWQAYQDGAPGMYWSRVWAIYMLLRWSRRSGVTI